MRGIVTRPTAGLLMRAATPIALALSAIYVLPFGASVRADSGSSSSAACQGGGFAVVLPGGTRLAGAVKTTVPAASLGTSFQVRGRYNQFDVVSSSLGITDYAFTGAPNTKDMTGGVFTPVYARKTPDHRGLTLTSNLSVVLDGTDIEISRTGPGLSMKITAKDCAQGGIFQMEPERGDGTATDFTHVLATAGANTSPNLTVFYFDNPNFRAREGDSVPFKDTTVVVPSRINFANDASRRFVGRDSPQVATRITQGCPNEIATRTGSTIVDHCGGVSLWRVSSGGRMGGVFGEDATEVAPPATTCTHQCKAQDQVRGQSTVLGFPFQVPDASRLIPRFPSGFQP